MSRYTDTPINILNIFIFNFTCLNTIIKSKFCTPQFSCWDSSISFGNGRIVIVISGIVIVFDCALCATSTPICVIYLYLYIFTGRSVPVCVRVWCAICVLACEPICGLKTDDWPGLVPPLFSMCITCLPPLFLPTRLSVLLSSGPFVVLWGAYKSKIFCNLPSKGNCGQIRLSTCDISNVRARVAQKGCPVQN